MDLKLKFLQAVLGTDGAKALQKAAQRSPELEHVLLPRAILAWLQVASRFGYEGEIPGARNTYVAFAKSEGEKFTGAVNIGEEVYPFEGETLYHVASSVAVALGYDHEEIDPALRDLDLARLGKSIDLLAKARVVVDDLAKRKTKKAEEPGQAHAPTPHLEPEEPEAPQKQPAQAKPLPKKPKLPKINPVPKLPKLAPLKLSEKQSEAKCPACGLGQFKAGQFRGCLCFRELAKAVKTEKTAEGYTLTFSGNWDEESVLTLAESMRK